MKQSNSTQQENTGREKGDVGVSKWGQVPRKPHCIKCFHIIFEIKCNWLLPLIILGPGQVLPMDSFLDSTRNIHRGEVLLALLVEGNWGTPSSSLSAFMLFHGRNGVLCLMTTLFCFASQKRIMNKVWDPIFYCYFIIRKVKKTGWKCIHRHIIPNSDYICY